MDVLNDDHLAILLAVVYGVEGYLGLALAYRNCLAVLLVHVLKYVIQWVVSLGYDEQDGGLKIGLREDLPDLTLVKPLHILTVNKGNERI